MKNPNFNFVNFAETYLSYKLAMKSYSEISKKKKKNMPSKARGV